MAVVVNCVKDWACASVCTSWSNTDRIKELSPIRHSDFRDHRPVPLAEIYETYKDVVQDGKWTMGLYEMWFWKNKAVKSSVHIPCWDSFKWNPLKWRGACMGRTCEECYWTGLRQTRWSRAVYAANLGREYVFPYQNIGHRSYKSDIKALCWMYCLMGCVFGCGVGQIFSLCGNFMFNFAAIYSCHAREKLRRRYKLPSSFGLPPGIDDFVVHFLCFYCASHQELRELAVRGVDGPGMHIFDVLPNSFANAEGSNDAIKERKALVDKMVSHPPKLFKSRPPRDPLQLSTITEAAKNAALRATGFQDDDTAPSTVSNSSNARFGWVNYPAGGPPSQVMSRDSAPSTATDVEKVPRGADGQPDWTVLEQELDLHRAPVLARSWSVAY